MRIVLVGYPGSQEIVPLSKGLIDKYIGIETIFLNYEGEISGWSNFVADHLETMRDEMVIFTLDDYLIRGCDKEKLAEACFIAPCVKLCASTNQEHEEYPVTTQYTIWDRKELIGLLRQTTSPWDFEINGSKLFKGTSVVHTCIDYDTSSALSSRWKGVHLNINDADR